MSKSVCPGCATSLPISQLSYEGYVNTTPECWSEVQGRQYGNVLLGRHSHQSTGDSYAAQHAGANHPDKSVAIHLAGLYLVIEQGVDPLEVAPKQQRIASGRTNWPRLTRPESRGVRTIFDVALSDDGDHIETVGTWARDVWEISGRSSPCDRRASVKANTRRPSWMTGGLVVAVFGAYVVALVLAARRWELPRLGWKAVGLLLFALAFELLAKFVFAALFRLGAARVAHPISWSGSVKAALTGSAVARLVPAGGTLTPTTMAWAVRSEDDQMAGVALRVTLLTYGGLLSMTGIAVLWGTSTGRHPLLFAGEVAVGVVLLLSGLAVFGGSPWLGQIVQRLPNWLRKHFIATARGRRLLTGEVILVVLRIGAEAGVLWGSFQALGIHLTPSEAMLTYGISAIIGGLPALPGGLVLVEGGLIGILIAYGFAAGSVVAPVLIYRVIDYWIPAGVGLGTWAVVASSRARTGQ